MSNENTDVLSELVSLSRKLGEPQLDLVILGEGNTSAQADSDTFWVKASGTELATAGRDTFVRVAFQPILEALDNGDLSDQQVAEVLKKATVEGHRKPSVETFLHALCLQLEGIRFVAHTHPTAALALLSSLKSRELLMGSLFPDQIVLLGPAPVYIPYTDPGLVLARSVRKHVERFVEQRERLPRVILMENHGVIALGSTATEALNITQMLVKTCRVLLGTLKAGGPRFLNPEQVERIDKRPDEQERRVSLK